MPCSTTPPALSRPWSIWPRRYCAKFGKPTEALPRRLDAARAVLEVFAPHGPALKAALVYGWGFPHWGVNPPLLSGIEEQRQALGEALRPWVGHPDAG